MLQFYIKRVVVCRENVIPFSLFPPSPSLRSPTLFLHRASREWYKYELLPRYFSTTVSRCVAVFLLLYGLPSSRKLFLLRFSFPPSFLSFSPLRCAARRISLFLFCASASFLEELFARVSIDMSFRSYLVLYMHTAVQTAGNKKTKGEMVTTLRAC